MNYNNLQLTICYDKEKWDACGAWEAIPLTEDGDMADGAYLLFDVLYNIDDEEMTAYATDITNILEGAKKLDGEVFNYTLSNGETVTAYIEEDSYPV